MGLKMFDYFIVVYINNKEVKRSRNALDKETANKTKSVMDSLDCRGQKVKIYHRNKLPAAPARASND